jgi:hypothetical protein
VLRGTWLTEATFEGNVDAGLHWVSQLDALIEPVDATALATASVNTAGARVLRGIQGLDPDGDAPLLLDGVTAEVDPHLDEIDGQAIPAALRLMWPAT